MSKARYWTGVCYPENMIEGWEEKIYDLIEWPFVYCKHSLDKDSKSEHRKDHVHIMFVWSSPTTPKAALDQIRRLSAPGRNCCPFVQAVHNVRNMYDYLIHDTESCRRAGKELYDKSERIEGNNFDIGMYEQISSEEKRDAAKEICEYVISRNVTCLSDIFTIVTQSEDFKDDKYWEAFTIYNAMIERICKSMYLKTQAANKDK